MFPVARSRSRGLETRIGNKFHFEAAKNERDGIRETVSRRQPLATDSQTDFSNITTRGALKISLKVTPTSSHIWTTRARSIFVEISGRVFRILRDHLVSRVPFIQTPSTFYLSISLSLSLFLSLSYTDVIVIFVSQNPHLLESSPNTWNTSKSTKLQQPRGLATSSSSRSHWQMFDSQTRGEGDFASSLIHRRIKAKPLSSKETHISLTLPLSFSLLSYVLKSNLGKSKSDSTVTPERIAGASRARPMDTY